jgi:hypothetical protein
MPDPTKLAELRRLLAARFPASARADSASVPTGEGVLDDALGGGLPAGAFTELVCTRPSSGGGLIVGSLLAATRAARQRVGLIDASDGFAPDEFSPEMLDHILWVRGKAGNLASLWQATDLLVRDEHFSAVVIDLRGVGERDILRTPASTWYRLQRAVERSTVAVLVLSPVVAVPCAAHRIILEASLTGEAWETERAHIGPMLQLHHERLRAHRALSA